MGDYFGRDLEAMVSAVNYHKWVIDQFIPYLGKKGAEVGAGAGNFTRLLVETDVERLVSFEPSDNMFPLLQKNTAKYDNVEAVHGYLGDKVDEYVGFFDSMLYVNVLEHIGDEQQELGYAKKVLKKDGYLLVFVPALQWLYSDFDKQVGHYRRYSKQTLRECVETAGFHIKHLYFLDMVGIIPWLLVFKLMKKTLSGGSVSLYDKMIVPVLRFQETMLHPPLGKNLVLIAQNK